MGSFKHLGLVFLLVALLTSSCLPVKQDFPQVQLRGVWVQGKSVMTPKGVDEVVRKARGGGFKQIFVGVFDGGATIYPSQIARQSDGVETGFDPLAYLVQEAHAQNIEVHAWFAVGRVANNKNFSEVIAEHPDWGLVGPDGRTMPWLNFTHPDARQFVNDVMMEAVAYGVDGIHFDYTRYPSEEWGFDNYSTTLFNQQHEFDLNELRYADLPAYAKFEGNALLLPSTARVLAEFSNGIPAVILNQYEDGQVLILNWQAGQRKTAIGSEILKRGISSFLGAGGNVYIVRSEMNIARYGDQTVSSVTSWLEALGWMAQEVAPEEMGGLSPASVVILPYVYLYSESDVAQLAQFVRHGGGAIFIDSPTPSINLGDLQVITGMLPVGEYFEEWLLITARSQDLLLPVSERTDDIKFYKTRNEEWIKFREGGINTLVKDVYTRVKKEHPNVLVTMTITSDQEKAAQIYLQDWKTWLGEGYIDALIPRAYEDTPEKVRGAMDAWLPDVNEYGRMTFGLIAYTEEGNTGIPKPPAQLIAEIKTVTDGGSNGFMLFDLDNMTEEQLKILAGFIPAKK